MITLSAASLPRLSVIVLAAATVAAAHAQPRPSADPSFGVGGAVFEPAGSWADAVMQPDGRILVVGSVNRLVNNLPDRDMQIVRLLPGGTRDTSFGIGGAVTIDFGGGRTDIANAVTLLPDGRIVVAGTSQAGLIRLTLGGIATSGYYTDVALARLLPGGQLDASFGSGGRVIADFSSQFSDTAMAVVALPDGALRVVGDFQTPTGGYSLHNDIGVFAFTPSGLLDTGFGQAGVAALPLGGGNAARRNSASAAALVGDRLLIAGTYQGAPLPGMPGSTAIATARVHAASGQPDASFGDGGITVVGFGLAQGSPGDEQLVTAGALAPQGDGSVLVGGAGEVFVAADDITDGALRPFVVRLTPAGLRDSAFAFPNGRDGGLLGGAVLGSAGGRNVVQLGGTLFPLADNGTLGAGYGPLVPATRRFADAGPQLLAVGSAGAEFNDGTSTSLSRYALDGSVSPVAPPPQVGFQLPPPRPGALVVQRLTATSVQLGWSDNSSNEQFFVLERASGPDFATITRFTLPAGTTSFRDSGLSRSTPYQFRLFASNPAGRSVEQAAGVTTPRR